MVFIEVCSGLQGTPCFSGDQLLLPQYDIIEITNVHCLWLRFVFTPETLFSEFHSTLGFRTYVHPEGGEKSRRSKKRERHLTEREIRTEVPPLAGGDYKDFKYRDTNTLSVRWDLREPRFTSPFLRLYASNPPDTCRPG